MIGKLIKRESASSNSQTFFNMMSTIMKSGVVFITMPVFTRLLGSEQYGEYAVYASWLSILGCFMGLNVKSSLGTGVIAFEQKYKEFRSSVLLEGTLFCLAISVILLLLYKPLNTFLKYPFILYCFLILEAVALFVTDFINFAWVYEKKAKNNMILASAIVIITSALSIGLIYIWRWDRNLLFMGRVVGTAVPHIVIAIVIWIVVIRREPARYDERYWKYGLHFGLPMVIHLLSQQVLVQSDRIMMRSMGVAKSEIGIYSFFYTFAAILTTILGALNNTWCPFLYEELKSKSYSNLNKRISYYVEVFTCISIGFLLVSREITYFFANSEYLSGMNLIPVFVFVTFTMFFYQFAVNYEIFNAKTQYVAIGTSIAALSNIALNYFLIGRMGMYGAGIATLLSYVILAVLHTMLVKKWKFERYPLSYKAVWIGMMCTFLGCCAFYGLAEWTVIRWGLAVIVGLYLVRSVYKRKTIF